METLSALMALCEEHSQVTGGFDVYIVVIQNKLFKKQLKVAWNAMTIMWH